jgi:hypothetical protein
MALKVNELKEVVVKNDINAVYGDNSKGAKNIYPAEKIIYCN